MKSWYLLSPVGKQQSTACQHCTQKSLLQKRTMVSRHNTREQKVMNLISVANIIELDSQWVTWIWICCRLLLSFATLSGCTFLTACSRHVKRHRLEDFLSLLYKLAKCATSKPLVEQVVSSSDGGEGSVVYMRGARPHVRQSPPVAEEHSHHQQCLKFFQVLSDLFVKRLLEF